MDLNQAAIQATADALIAVDTTGTITRWNPAAERLLGFPATDAIGQTLAIIIPPQARPAHIAGFHRAMKTGHTDTGGAPVLVTATRADTTLVEAEMALAVLPGEDGSPAGAVAALRPAGHRRPLVEYAPTRAG